MEADRLTQCMCPSHGFLHQFLRKQRLAVIGKSCCLLKALHIHQLLSLHALCHGSTGADPDPGLFPSGKYIGKCLLIIHTGLGIGHQHDTCIAALLRRLSAAQDILLISKAGIPEMHMSIDQPGSGQKPCGIYDLCPVRYLCLCFLSAF